MNYKHIMKGSIFAAVLAVTAMGAHADAAFVRYLQVGSMGTDVAELQTKLESQGFLVMPAGVAKGTFGQLTKNALIKWQAAVGLPATGYFGPMSIAKINATGSTSNGNGNGSDQPADNGGLKGGDGDFKNFKLLGSPNSKDIDEGDSENVLGFQFEADDSDLRVDRLKVQVAASGNEKPWKFIDSLELYNGSKKVASIDAGSKSDWDEQDSGQYEISFDKINSVVKENQTAKFYVAVVAKDNIDDSDLPVDFSIFLSDAGLRAMNAEKINVYEGRESQTKDFTISEVQSGSVQISVDSSDNKNADVEVEENDTTDDVTLYNAQIKSKDGDNTIDEVRVNLASLDSTNLSRMITTLYLYIDGDEVGSESVDGTSDTVRFDDIDFDLHEDEEVDLVVKADIDEQDGNYTNGSGVKVTGTAVDFTDQNDDDQTITDSTAGGEITFNVDAVGASAGKTSTAISPVAGDESKGRFFVEFKITAPRNSDIYIPKGATLSTSSSSGAGAVFHVVDGNGDEVTATTSTANSLLTRVAGGSETGGYYKITKGNTATLRLDVIVENTGAANARTLGIQLDGVNYKAGSTGAVAQQYSAGFDEDYRSDTAYLLTSNTQN